jgi:hypothetical protein
VRNERSSASTDIGTGHLGEGLRPATSEGNRLARSAPSALTVGSDGTPERVPIFVGIEVAVPHLSPAWWWVSGDPPRTPEGRGPL